MLPSKHRLTIPQFLSNPRNPTIKIQNPYFSFLTKKSIPGPTRIVFVVPKRLSKLATRRNRTKRVLSAAFQPFISQIKSGFSIALYSRKILLKEKPQYISKIIEEVLKQSHLL